MEDLSSNPQPSPEQTPRKRGRKPGNPLTARELATRRANLEKARAALREGYPPTEKRLRASRANLQKAIAARRAPEGNASARLNAVKHGLFAGRTLAASVERLGEDKEEFDLHLRLFERVFAPLDDAEKRLVRGLAETVWRRLRFFRAQACWEKERLISMFAEAPAPAQLTLSDTLARADGLAMALTQFEAFFRELRKLESQVEFYLRKLIRKRSRGCLTWKGFSQLRDLAEERFEREEQWHGAPEQWAALSPEEQAALRNEVRAIMDAETDE